MDSEVMGSKEFSYRKYTKETSLLNMELAKSASIKVVELEDGGTVKWKTAPYFYHDENSRPWTQILRVNKAIHGEASDLLFSEGIIIVHAIDLLFLTPKGLKYGIEHGQNPWRHNPLTAVAKRLPCGTIKYDNEDLGGTMDPHTFAKFKNVHFACELQPKHTIGIHMDPWEIDTEDANKLRKYLVTLTLVKDFVKLLSKSKVINKLCINLLVEVVASSNLDTGVDLMLGDDHISIPDESLSAHFSSYENKRAFGDYTMRNAVACMIATDIFMDTNTLNPLKHLRNVRLLNFQYGYNNCEPFPRGTLPIEYIPSERHLKVTQQMKHLVEGNFKEPKSTRPGLRSQWRVI
ncbi:hypothetical protein NHQ30_010195 [Ciborinia camelliae]|nr:hypothetical protein NHQ30_010195 [Ciborinia camelliae]